MFVTFLSGILFLEREFRSRILQVRESSPQFRRWWRGRWRWRCWCSKRRWWIHLCDFSWWCGSYPYITQVIMASDLSSWCIEIHLFTDWVNSPTRSFPLISGNDIYVPCWFLYILYNGEIASMFSKLLMLIFHCAKFDACWRISCARGLVTWLMKCSESVLSMYFTFDINRWNSCFSMCLCLIMSMVVDSFSWMRNETSKELDALFKNLFICSRSGVYYFQIEF